MTLAAFTTFLLAAVALAITPGPGIAYVVARTVAGGRAEGMASCIGTALGGLLHVAAAALGLSLVIAQSAFLFNALKYVGAAYLVYLGLRMLLQKPRAVSEMAVQSLAEQGGSPVAAATIRGSGNVRRAFAEGIMVEALNVKTALFFLAFLPQFVSPASSLIGQMVLMGCVCVTLNTLADVVAVLLAHRLLQSSGARAQRERWLTRASGVTMLALGGFLALAKRQS